MKCYGISRPSIREKQNIIMMVTVFIHQLIHLFIPSNIDKLFSSIPGLYSLIPEAALVVITENISR